MRVSVSFAMHICIQQITDYMLRYGCFQALTRLCEQTECDVRSCLNTLQFLARKGRPIKVADLNGLSIGQKDISKGAFSIWQDLTQIKASPCSLI